MPVISLFCQTVDNLEVWALTMRDWTLDWNNKALRAADCDMEEKRCEIIENVRVEGISNPLSFALELHHDSITVLLSAKNRSRPRSLFS